MIDLERKKNYLDVYFNNLLILEIVDMNPGISVWDYYNNEHITVKGIDIDSAYREVTPLLDKLIRKLSDMELQNSLDLIRKKIMSKGNEIRNTAIKKIK
jgi:hypothetical protein